MKLLFFPRIFAGNLNSTEMVEKRSEQLGE